MLLLLLLLLLLLSLLPDVVVVMACFMHASRDTFERVAQMKEAGEAEVRVEMSFLEIYIENVYDLLAAADTVRG